MNEILANPDKTPEQIADEAAARAAKKAAKEQAREVKLAAQGLLLFNLLSFYFPSLPPSLPFS